MPKTIGDFQKEIVGYEYIGKGAYLHGIPARDLDLFEYEQYKEYILANERASSKRLYKPIFTIIEIEENEDLEQ